MKKLSFSSKSQTDWTKIDAMTDQDIDFSDCPEITSEMLSKATIRRGNKLKSENKKSSEQS